jgi:hypothetical protein
MSSSPDPLHEPALTAPSSPNESTNDHPSPPSPILKHRIKSIIKDPAVNLDLKLDILNRHQQLRDLTTHFTVANHDARSNITELAHKRGQVERKIGVLEKYIQGCVRKLKIKEEWQLRNDDFEGGPVSFQESLEFILRCRNGGGMTTKVKRLRRLHGKLHRRELKLEAEEREAHDEYAKAQAIGERVARFRSALAEQVNRILSNKVSKKIGDRWDSRVKTPPRSPTAQSCLVTPSDSDEEYDADDDSDHGPGIAVPSNASIASTDIESAAATCGSRDGEHMIYDFVEDVEAELNRREDALEVREIGITWKEQFLDEKAAALIKNTKRIVKHLKRRLEESEDMPSEGILPKRRKIH